MASPDPRSPHQQVADLIRSDIRAGRLRPGDPLPAIRRLAEIHGVAPNTAQRAVEALQRDGLVTTVTGRGSFIADGAGEKAPVTLEGLAEVVENLGQRLATLEGELRRRSHKEMEPETGR